MGARVTDPALAFQYSIVMTKPIPITGYFTEISGLSEEHEVIEHKVMRADGSEHTYMIPGRWKPNPITLKRGRTVDGGFWAWRNMIREKKIKLARANISIFLYNRHYTPIMHWNLVEAWPSKLSEPEFKADSNDIAIEELTIVYERLTVGT